MHHEENVPRHHRHRHRDMRHPHEHHPHEHLPPEEHFHDFRSRWGDPDPLIHLNHQPHHPRDIERLEDWERYRQQMNQEWHDPRHNQYEPPHREPPIWQQQDVYFDRSNQRVEDRWFENDSPMMPRLQHPERLHRQRMRDTRRDDRDHNEPN